MMTQITSSPSSFSVRAETCENLAAKKLMLLMEEKQTNLSFNPDVTSVDDFLRLVDLVGPEICLLKSHIDILDDFTPSCITELVRLSQKHQFLIMEDRKFADIGSISQKQYAKGLYRIVEWADFVTVHTVPGPGILQGLKEVGLEKERGVFLLAEMSSEGSLAKGAYTQSSVDIAFLHADFVAGFVTQRHLTDHPGFLNFTPGCSLSAKGDHLGQQFNTPDLLVGQKGSDIITVGRGIYQAKDPKKEAQRYREKAWKAYLQKIHSSQ